MLKVPVYRHVDEGGLNALLCLHTRGGFVQCKVCHPVSPRKVGPTPCSVGPFAAQNVERQAIPKRPRNKRVLNVPMEGPHEWDHLYSIEGGAEFFALEH